MSPASSFTAGLRCPDDGHLLQAHQGTRVPFSSCRHCDGLWLAREAIEKGGKPSFPSAGELRSAKVSATANRMCPQCSTKLDAETVDELVIDVCPACGGVWLDPGEYQAARRRSVRLRFERDLPTFRHSSSSVVRLIDRIIDAVGERMIEEEEFEEFDARALIPRKRRDR